MTGLARLGTGPGPSLVSALPLRSCSWPRPTKSEEAVSSISEVDVRSRIDRLLEADPSDRRGFLGAPFDLGLAWVHFPEAAVA